MQGQGHGGKTDAASDGTGQGHKWPTGHFVKFCVDIEGPEQTALLHSLIRAFTVRKCAKDKFLHGTNSNIGCEYA